MKASAVNGHTKTFAVKVKNVGAATASYTVAGTAKTAGFKVQYFDDASADITADIVAGTYQINDLGPGTEKSLSVAVKATAHAPHGAVKGRKRVSSILT